MTLNHPPAPVPALLVMTSLLLPSSPTIDVLLAQVLVNPCTPTANPRGQRTVSGEQGNAVRVEDHRAEVP